MFGEVLFYKKANNIQKRTGKIVEKYEKLKKTMKILRKILDVCDFDASSH